MGFADFFKQLFSGVQANEDGSKIVYIDGTGYIASAQNIAMERLAIQTAIGLLAAAAGKCEFRTFDGEKELFGEEYFLWNYAPNRNQSKQDFLTEIVTNLLTRNECLCVEVGGRLIIAETYEHREYVMKEDTFHDVSRGTLTFSKPFSQEDVLFFQLNDENITNALKNCVGRYCRLLEEAANKYDSRDGEKLLLKIDALEEGDPRFKDRFQKLMNNDFKTFFTSKNAVLPLYNGWNVSPLHESRTTGKAVSDITDLKAIRDQIFDNVAVAFHIPVALLKGDVADIEAVTDNFLTFALERIMGILETEINRKRYGRAVLTGQRLKISTNAVKHLDLLNLPAGMEKAVYSGVLSPNEVRRVAGEPARPEAWADLTYMTKNWDALKRIAEGGEGN